MLLEVALTVIDAIKLALADDGSDAQTALDWLRYLFCAHGLIMLAMLIGATSAVGELSRARVRITSLVVAAIGFLIATAIVAWSYEVLTAITHTTSIAEVLAREDDLKLFPKLAAVKTLAYGVGLIALVAAVEAAAQSVGHIALRDEAGSMKRALIVMLGGDVFYQLAAGAGGVGMLGLVAELLIGGFWIYCHVRLARFLFNAAYLITDVGGELPIATAVAAPVAALVKAPVKPPVAPARPAPLAAPPVVAAPLVERSAPTPIAAPKDGEPPPDEPKLLR